MKVFFTISILAILGNTLTAQTLFTYGKNAASKDEFLKAFNKNYQGKSSRDEALKEYLELYIRFKLKVQAAYDMHLDTLQNQLADLNSFRQQLEAPYLTDQKELDRLTKEAFDRSQKDIRLSQIIVPFRQDHFSNPNPVTKISAADNATAHKKIQEVLEKLKKGEDFEKLVQEYSADPNIKLTKGDLGFITVFILPYEIETIAYGLALNKYSQPHTSKIGYHIFKKTGERPAAGRIKASQILLAIDPSAASNEKVQKHKLADSLYNVLKKGSSFEALAKQFSNDRNTYLNGGRMPEFGVGEFEPTFENAVFGLKKDGELSKPIETSFGYHLVKRESHIPVVKTQSSAESELRLQVQNDSRANLARVSFEKQLSKIVIPKKSTFDQTALWNVTDTFLRYGKIISQKTINEKTVLFTFPGNNITTTEWIAYFANTRGDETKNSLSYARLMEEFITYSSVEYYRTHLEDYNQEFRIQFNEFKEGNLLFEIMERKVWTMAGNDSVGLRKYYTEHQEKYQWGKSADALLFDATDEASANMAAKEIKKDLNSWKKISNESEGRILADSGRFELSQIAITDPGSLKPGIITPVQLNQQDNSASFTYIIKLYTQPAQRSFEDARGLVMNDYQVELEEKWVKELKAKYPVQVNEKVFQSMLNKK